MLRKAIGKLKAIFSRPEPAVEKAREEESDDSPVFERLGKKRKRLEANAVEKALALAPEIREEARALSEAIEAVESKSVDPGIAFYRIATEHQRSFASRIKPLQKELEAMEFPSDCDGLVSAQGKLAEVLASTNRVVIDNRYVYAFFEKELAEFNRVMKRLFELNESLAQALQPAYAFKTQCSKLEERKKSLLALEQRIRLLEDQREGSEKLTGRCTTEASEFEKQIDYAGIEKTKNALAEAADAERRFEGRFYSFLESVEGALKKYARGKATGAFASTAERYLRDKTSFLADCLEGNERLEKLFADLEQSGLADELNEFKQCKGEWAKAVRGARATKCGLEEKLKKLEAPKSRLAAAKAAIENAQREARALGEKTKALKEKKTADEKGLADEAERVLSE